MRDVGDCCPVDTPVNFESEAALYLEIKARLAEFVIQIPLVESEPPFEVGSVEPFAVNHHGDGRREGVMRSRRMKEIHEVLREEIVIPVIHEAPSVWGFAVTPLFVFIELNKFHY